jgi:hypothetical protein
MLPGWRTLSLIGSVWLAVVGLSGCNDRVWDFGVQLIPPDGGFIDAGRPDAGSGRGGNVGLAGRGGQGGQGGSAGRGGQGGSAGSGGTGAIAGGGGSSMACNNNAPERQTDISNCGTCFKSCLVPNSNPACVAGQCRKTCFTDFYDADGNEANGCECIRTNAGVEACDGLDNDCDGMVDEGFDFMTDEAHCGGCNVPCSIPFATSSCTGGICQMVACLPGFYDRSPIIPGCETACQTTNGGVEICDGQDNDCDGVIDDSPMAATITCRSMGVCAGVQPVCRGTLGWTCTYPANHQDLEDTARGCDGLDNDCDGRVDEPFGIGTACTVGSGACAGVGTWVCDNTMAGNRRCMGSPKTPGTEVCNGLDDDCDGKVDELDSASNRTTDDRLVYNSARNVTMFAYEATRYDASGTNYGFDSSRRPCSVAGRLPWTNVTKEEAEAACERIGTGWRLCTATEWADVCNGSGNTTFPYSGAYAAGRCNGADYPKTAGQTTVATGAATMCVSDQSTAANDELLDMSGNVKEWVLTSTTTPLSFELRGGAYNTPSFTVNGTTTAPGLQCDAATPAPSVAVRLPSVGFRCCRTGTLPN